jgi:hypothetical protein
MEPLLPNKRMGTSAGHRGVNAKVRASMRVHHRVIFDMARGTLKPSTTREKSKLTSLFTMGSNPDDVEALVRSDDPEHPANHICTLCAKFYNLGWVRLVSIYTIDLRIKIEEDQ